MGSFGSAIWSWSNQLDKGRTTTVRHDNEINTDYARCFKPEQQCKLTLYGREYNVWRHNKIAQVLHWEMCNCYGFKRSDRWHNYAIQPVLKNENHKILWDFNIQTDHKLEHNRPDIVVIEKKSRKAWIYDIACPFETRVIHKENKKVERYQDLKREMVRLWKLNKSVRSDHACGDWCIRHN